MRSVARLLLLSLIFLLFSRAYTYAQSDIILDVPDLPEGTGSLPEPGNSDPIGVIINQYNAPSYKKVISPEVYMLIRSAGLTLDAARRLKYTWRFDDQWEQQSVELKNRSLGLDNKGYFQSNFELFPGFPFGPSTALRNDWNKINPSIEGSREPLPGASRSNIEAKPLTPDQISRFGNQLLWNMLSLNWRFAYNSTEFDWSWVKDGKVIRSAAGEIVRVFPGLLESQPKNEQLFREIIEFKSPASIDKYSWLTFRFRGADEDTVWVYSPATQKSRQVTSSNRSDSLLTSPASADDLLGWSGKIGTVSPDNVELVTALVPFASLDIAKLQPNEDGCYAIRPSEQTLDSRFPSYWNFKNRRFPGDASWAPSASEFVPRRLWKLELAIKDPYSLYGRSILYIDASAQVPIYNVIFDRTGKRFKTIINGYGLAAAPDRSVKIPFLAFAVVLDHQSETALLVDYAHNEFCRNLPTGVTLDRFTPGKLLHPTKVADFTPSPTP